MWTAGCTSNISRTRKGRLLVSLVLIGTVWMAGYLEIQSQRHLILVKDNALQALRLRAIAFMEGMEEVQWQRQADYDQMKGSAYEKQAKDLEHRSKEEADLAARDRKRGEHLQEMAQEDEEKAQTLEHRAETDDDTRLEILANLTSDQDEWQYLQDQVRERGIHSGACESTKVFHALCAMIGGTAGLEKQEMEEKAQIVQDTKNLQQMEKQEYIDRLVADFLLGKAREYNKTSQELLELAQAWDVRSNRDAQLAKADQDEAQEYFHAEAYLENRVQQEDDWRKGNALVAHHLWEEAENQIHLAYRDALVALILAVIGLIYFVPKAIRKGKFLWRATMAAAAAASEDHQELHRKLSQGILHLLIVLLVAGLVDSEYLLHLGAYHILSRAVIVIWFASLVAGVHTMALQTIPHFLAARDAAASSFSSSSLDAHCLGEIALQSILKWTFLTAFVIMEFLVLQLTVGSFLFAPDALHFLSQWFVRILVPMLLVLHIMAFEPSTESLSTSSRSSSDQSTVLMEASLLADEEETDDLDDASMPLQTMSDGSTTTTESSAAATEELPLIYLSGMRQRLAARRRLFQVEHTAHAIHVPHECCKLAWMFQLLLIVCCLSVIGKALPLTWLHHPWVLLVLLLVVPCCLAVVAAYFAHRGVSNNQDGAISGSATPWFVTKARNEGYMKV